MKNTKILMIIIATSLMYMSCGPTCDSGYTSVNINGQDICMPDYIAGEAQNFDLGNEFYHQKFGVIIFNNGKWTDLEQNILTDSDLND
ncbi:MAG: hypothetical protein R3342_03690 [Lutibacter sp.]|jgi:hypothetical protein|uniref:hypothetical protein n=1 Tax=Lutibacter sp. TaxID=1925666 RepID=UPI00299F0361|nr:hypothetical protein [Lutibacter sp.]MDX1828629.1 hypothetical protein [Lutibacter sp.]